MNENLSVYQIGLASLALFIGCQTPAAPKPKEEEPPPAQTSPTTKPMRLGSPTPQQAVITARNWLSELRAQNTERINFYTSAPFYGAGLMPTEGPNAESCKGKDRAETQEALASTLSCLFQNNILRENIPTNLEARSVFEIKLTSLEGAFRDQKELTQIHAQKKALTADCCRAYVQAFFPGDKANVYFLFAIAWIKGDIRVVGVLSEVDPIE